MNRSLGTLLGRSSTEALPSSLPPSLAKEEARLPTASAETQGLEERIDQPELATMGRPPRVLGQAISYKELIAVVQEAGALANTDEAETASKAVLSELGGCVSWHLAQNLADWLPKPLRQLVSRRSFESSMSRFAPHAFLAGVAAQERVGSERTARFTRALLLALDRSLPTFLTEQLHTELASLWAPLTHLQVHFEARPRARSVPSDSAVQGSINGISRNPDRSLTLLPNAPA
jgi:hypothetical protein